MDYQINERISYKGIEGKILEVHGDGTLTLSVGANPWVATNVTVRYDEFEVLESMWSVYSPYSGEKAVGKKDDVMDVLADWSEKEDIYGPEDELQFRVYEEDDFFADCMTDEESHMSIYDDFRNNPSLEEEV